MIQKAAGPVLAYLKLPNTRCATKQSSKAQKRTLLPRRKPQALALNAL